METERLATEYEGFFAEFFDILQPYAPEVKPYLEVAGRLDGPVLELGSGTGRLLVPLARAGLTIDGIDNALDMTSRCRAKLKAEPEEVRSRVRLFEEDLREYRLDRAYSVIYASNNVLNHLLDPQDLLRTFRTARAHLLPGGTFVADLSAPDLASMRRGNGVEEVSEFVHPERGTQLVSRFRPRYDFLEQLERDEIDLTEFDGDQAVRRAVTTVESRFYLPAELRLGLVAAGFEIVEERGSLSGRPLAEGCPEIVILARPAAEDPGR